MTEKENREEAEARAKRIKRWQRSGAIFDATPDLRWLFVKLAMANGGEIDVLDEDRLREFISEPIWAEIFSGRDNLDELLRQGAVLVENPKFQCTALRDFLAKRIIACLIPEVKEQKRSRTWQIIAILAVIGAFALIGWWGFIVVGFIVWLEVGRLKLNERLKATNQEAAKIYSEVSLGGFDEHVIICRLEALEKYHIPIPSVLCALLRLPRRNVEAEIADAFNTLDSESRDAIWQQWKAFLDFMLKNDDGEADRKARHILENHRAEIFQPIRDALNELSDHFKDDPRIEFTSKPIDKSLPSSYQIQIKRDGKQQYYIYVRCEKESLETEMHSFPMRVVRNPNVFSEWLFFLPGDEQKIVSIIGALLLDYQQRDELTVENVKDIVQRHKSARQQEQQRPEHNAPDDEAKEVMRVKMMCEVAHGSAEAVREAEDDPEWISHERKRYEKHRAMALGAAKAIADEFYRDAAVHSIIDLCMTAGDRDEAKTLFRSVRTDMIRDKILEAHPTLR